MTFNFLGPGLTVNVEAKVKEQIILDSSAKSQRFKYLFGLGRAVGYNPLFSILKA